MEDSLKGYLIMIVISSIFITAIINFLVLFPQEQGAVFSGADQSSYLQIANLETNPTGDLSNINNLSNTGFNEWDITVGFMGSNTQKATKGGISQYSNNVFSNILTLAKTLFGENSPIVWAITILISTILIFVTYLFIKFLRTGN